MLNLIHISLHSESKNNEQTRNINLQLLVFLNRIKYCIVIIGAYLLYNLPQTQRQNKYEIVKSTNCSNKLEKKN